MSSPQRKRLPGAFSQGSSSTTWKETEGDPGPHHPLPEPALKLGPHSSA